ncbi:hypothetical protein [Acinetobacter baumannii]|uniref:hypothetical protein n=1 Tax=Acinetobacter baumannii TaxID=470 RepID=UPI000E2C3EC7|nr:hypothetical protein [Acinetobacter baumannii]RDJ54669.1 hypothetical protein AB721_08595 [Acinetobacter baumannii]
MPIHTEHDPRLKSTLKTRHISMLALGGVIGAGLFVGSSSLLGVLPDIYRIMVAERKKVDRLA